MAIFTVIRKSAAQFTAENPLLAENEIGIETDVRSGVDQATGKAKVGNGAQRWSSMDYWNPSGVSAATAASIGALINGATTATLSDTDLVPVVQSSVTLKATLTAFKAFFKTYFDTLYDAIGAAAALLTQTITNGDTTHAPSGDAVFDALALKQTKSYNSYVVRVTQASAGAPTVDATLQDEITVTSLTRETTGIYRINKTGVFLAGKWWASSGAISDGASITGFYSILSGGDDRLLLLTSDLSGALSDNLLLNTPIEVRVYL